MERDMLELLIDGHASIDTRRPSGRRTETKGLDR
jgi:hypothetical protein